MTEQANKPVRRHPPVAPARLRQLIPVLGLELLGVDDDGTNVTLRCRYRELADGEVVHTITEHNVVLDLADPQTRTQLAAGMLPEPRPND